MENINLSLEAINGLIDKLVAKNIGEIYIKEGDFELKIKAKEPPAVHMQTATQAQPSLSPSAIGSLEINLPAPVEEEGNLVKSPIVGTFYAQAAPSKPPFVSVGTKVRKGDVLFVIESMKLMNEVQSDFDGEVVKVIAQDGQAVEYGQPIMIIE